MKLYIFVFSSALIIMLSNRAQAQVQVKKDTVFYLVDTAKIPVADRMFLVGEEGDLYGYRLTCQCYPMQNDAFFIYNLKTKGEELEEVQFKKIKFITLRKLISIVVQYGLDKKRKTVFYFIEPNQGRYIMHNVELVEPYRSGPSIDVISIPPTEPVKQKKRN